MPRWLPDVLGSPFECAELELPADAEGPVSATLVRRVRDEVIDGPGVFDVLYVHGWSDYFFQRDLAEYWVSRGARFFALDLRKYGRSLRPHQTPGYIEDLAAYDEEIDAALDVIRTQPAAPLVLMGHSTGGLTLSLWASRHPDLVDGLVLNAPWLEWQTRAVGRALLEPAIGLGAALHPHAEFPEVDLGFYSRSVRSRLGGEWEYDETWRPERGFHTNRGWLNAVLRGQATVSRGLGIRVPILVLLSTRSMLQPAWSEQMRYADTAIEVGGVARRAPDLGLDVTIRRIEGALHDATLSSAPVRAVVWEAIDRWLPAVVDGAPRPAARDRASALGIPGVG
ncbi:alpha/beta hydrolase [Agromyces aurantiacus]|uniref:Alpha/beta hydrolase n=1 Tax=Agromyces aurantiacus TaxID=165814 RepID=A0ABV9RF00_9MICO|nr:alpha/beta hydrolase [Agromyces aurantiacus]MBM7505403.1 alpha-beta hydrolase superfamily lysophospholipase [Agromyces aurantiacus]